VTGRRRRSRQSGQAVVLVALAMVAMIGMTSLVISGGALYVARRQAQQLADGAALAGAARIPCSGQNAYAAIDGLLSTQLNTTPTLSQTPAACGSASATWSRTYPDGTQVTATYPYAADTTRIAVSIVSAQVPLPLGGIFGTGPSTVAARAVAKGVTPTSWINYAVYVQSGINCGGNSPINVSGSIYSGGPIDSHCSLYAHTIAGYDQGNVSVYPSGQLWTQGGGSCLPGVVTGNAVCADGWEISSSQCPTPLTTDFLGAGRLGYPCPGSAASPGLIATPEPNADSAALATIGGTACNPNGTAAAYPLLYAKGTSKPIGRMRPGQAVVNGATVSNAPYKDAFGYYHLRPGCYGWLDVSQITQEDGAAKPALVMDPGLYYFSGYFQSSDGDPTSAGGVCVGSGFQLLGKDVTLEFTSNVDPASLSTSNCAQVPTSTSSGAIGANPLTPVVDGTNSYSYLSAPCSPTTTTLCPLAGGSSWCALTDPACAGVVVWAPPGPPSTSLPAINGTYYVKGSQAYAYMYGAVFWPGSAPFNVGCQWTANGTSAIVGALVCLSLQQQGGAVSQGNGIFYAQANSSTTGGKSGLTE